jgi:Domain of unknown function (DUF3854)/Domain of unknown function (DUF927)
MIALGGALNLYPQHREDLRASGLSDNTITACGFYSADADKVATILGFPVGPGLVLPYGSGSDAFKRVKPDHRYEDCPKYLSPRGSGNHLYVPAILNRATLTDASTPLYITEGEKKAAKAVQEGLACIGLAGVWSWRGKAETGEAAAIPDLDDIAWDSRKVYVVFDSDLMDNEQVAHAESALADELARRGAEVFGIRLPAGKGNVKIGLDDYLMEHDVATFRQLPSVLLATPTVGVYLVSGARLCRVIKDGVAPLASFTAHVVEEVTVDDGLEAIKHFVIEGQEADGVALPRIRIPAARFNAMDWVTANWGVRAVVNAGMGIKDHLRAAIQTFSKNVTERRIYAHTGWRLIDGDWCFLTSSGAVGRRGIEVELPTGLQGYRLPGKSTNARVSARMTFELLDLAPHVITVPLLAAVFRAPLAHFLTPSLSLWLQGRSGSHKSSLAAVFLSHFGSFTVTSLPGAWSSTRNALERHASVLKDVVYLVDDYAPDAKQRDMEAVAQSLIRGQGNQAGRARLGRDLADRPAFKPRGLIVATGEQHPSGASVLARTVLLELERGNVDLQALTVAQERAARGVYADAMTGYIEWLTPQANDLPSLLSQNLVEWRRVLTQGAEHARIPESLAHLCLGLEMLLHWARELDAISDEQSGRIWTRSQSALITLGREQAGVVEDQRATRVFLRTLSVLLETGAVRLLPKAAAEDVTARGDVIGWQDEHAAYLIFASAYRAVVRFHRDSGRDFPFTEERVRRELMQEGLSRCEKDRFDTTARCGGKPRRVVELRREALDGVAIEEAVTSRHQKSPASGDGPSREEVNEDDYLRSESLPVTTVTTH